jgi:hypothetical protein
MRCDATLLIQARFPKFTNVRDGTGFDPLILVLNDLLGPLWSMSISTRAERTEVLSVFAVKLPNELLNGVSRTSSSLQGAPAVSLFRHLGKPA